MRIGTQARSFGLGIYENETQFLSVVREAGELGFEGLESNWRNLEPYFGCPEAFARPLETAGLALIGAHCGGALADAATFPDVLQTVGTTATFVAALHGEAIVFSCQRPSEDSVASWRMVAGRLNRLGIVCRSHGVYLLCHNHWWEPEGVGLEALVQETDPELVGFAFDTGHCTRAGRDAVAMLVELADRVRLVHLTDWDGAERPPLGEGMLDMEAARHALASMEFAGWLALEEQTEFGRAGVQVAASLQAARRVAGRA